MSPKIAVFPGTFDPVTNGHIDLIKRAASLFDKVIIAVAKNARKNPLFSLDERVKIIEDVLKDSECLSLAKKFAAKDIIVTGFENLLVEFAKQNNADVVIRGIRVVTDFEYEFQMANMNRRLNDSLETVFLTPSEQYSFTSSTIVKEIARLDGDVSQFAPNEVLEALKNKLG